MKDVEPEEGTLRYVFHLSIYHQKQFILSQMRGFHSSLWLDTIPLCICTTFSLSTYQALDCFHFLAVVNSAAVNMGMHTVHITGLPCNFLICVYILQC
jgi:hypothetical protein